MSLREAAEQALEALEKQHNWMVANGGGEMFAIPSKKAINELRQALAQPEQEPLGGEWVPCVKLPVIVHVRNQRDGENHISTREGITPVLPEDLIMRGVAGEEYPIGRELFERTYTFDTAPPKREWVGLTDYEIESELTKEFGQWWSRHVSVCRAIEAKLKEKNNG